MRGPQRSAKQPSGLRGNRDYTLYWSASMLSGLGSQLSVIAYPLLVLSIGGRAAQAGLVVSCSLITRTVLRLPAGQIADRVSRRRLMFVMDLIRFAGLASIPVADAGGWLGVPQLLGVAVVEGAGTALFGPAASILVRDIVPKELLTRAFSRNQAKAATFAIVGPALGGLFFAVNRVLPFTLDAASYALSAALVLGIRTRPAERTPTAAEDRRLTAGLRWLRGRPGLMRLLIYGSVMNLVAAGMEVVVIVGLRVDGAHSSVIGLVIACAGVGGIIGAVLAERILRWFRPVMLYLSVGTIWTAGLVVFAVLPIPAVIGPVLALLVLLTPPLSIRMSQITAGEAPRELLGRITTAETTISSGLGSLGPLLVGLLLERAGVSAAWAALAGLSLLATVAASGPMLRAQSILDPGQAEPGPADRGVADPSLADGGLADSDLADPASKPAADPVPKL
jgi:MFS family permease